MTGGFTAEEFEPDAAENTASDGASDTTAKVNGSDGGNTTGGNNAGNASTGGTGNTTAGGNTGEAVPAVPATLRGRCSAPPPITVSPARS